jgi:Alw26I/Eco31I/Esp3I family type II restriction m6 adenine DNA methyltransferase
LAWSIVKSLYSEVVDVAAESSIDPRALAEAARIAALTWTVAKYTDSQADELIRAPVLLFSNLSFRAEQDGVSSRGTLEMAQSVLEVWDDSSCADQVKSCTPRDLAELIAQIHSYGCFSLLAGRRGHPSRRSLGAIYTPLSVSDYICEMIIGAELDRRFAGIQRGDLEEFEQFLSLKVLDPACGPGAFLISAIEVFRKRRSTIEAAAKKVGLPSIDLPGLLRENLFGVDIDKAALEIADISIALLLGQDPTSATSSTLGRTLKQGNSLVMMNGWDGSASHTSFFEDSASRCPFEWQSEFPDILARGARGFDFIVMNPPYERLKPNLAEFLREGLQSGDRTIHLQEFEDYKVALREDIAYFRNSGEYALGNRYTINTYRLFIEQALRLARYGGRLGFVVPSTLLGDISARLLRRHLLSTHCLLRIDEYTERARLFPGVTQSVCVMTVETYGTTESLSASFGLSDVHDAQTKIRLKLKVADIEQVMGESMVIPRVNQTGWQILKTLHKNPALGSLPWLQNRRGELDLTLSKEHIRQGKNGNRLVRGADISRYTLRPIKRKSESVKLLSFVKSLGSSVRSPHIFSSRIACQQVSNRAQRWRLKFAMVPPKTVLANSCNYVAVDLSEDEWLLSYLLGILNSDLLNWRFDLSNTNNHVSNRELASLPIANPHSQNQRTNDLVGEMVKDVQDVLSKGGIPSSSVEARVFLLYGLGLNEARFVMTSRGASQDEVRETMTAMSEMA